MAGGFEGENPTRRYKWFRPRQAARGFILDTSGSDHPTGGLFNDSTAAQYIVVREFISGAVANGTNSVGVAYVQGQPGTIGGTLTPLIPGSGKLPGALWSADRTAFYTPDFSLPVVSSGTPLTSWLHDFPLAILPPGWSLALAGNTTGGDVCIAALWEAIYPEELDWLY